jgi:hypothetical protein
MELAADVTVEEMVRVPGDGERGDGRAAPGPYQARPGLALLPLGQEETIDMNRFMHNIHQLMTVVMIR